MILNNSKAYLQGRVFAAFFILTLVPLFQSSMLPYYSLQIFGIHVILVLFFSFWGISSFIKNRDSSTPTKQVHLSLVDILFILFYLFYFLSCFFSVNKPVSLITILTELPFIFLYIFFRILSKNSFSRSAPLFCITAVVLILSVWGLLQYFFEIDVSPGLKSLFKTHHFPVTASLGNPNFLAEFLLLAAPVTIACGSFTRRYVIVAIIFIMQGLTIFFTYSRLAWVVLFLFMLISLFFASQNGRKKIALLYILFLVISVSFFTYHYKTDSPRSLRIVQSFSFANLSNPEKNKHILSERELIYSTSIAMLKKAPFRGMGPGAFGHSYLQFQGKTGRNLTKNHLRYNYLDLKHAHSDFLEIGIDSGYGTLALYILLLLYAVFAGFKNLLRGQEQRNPFKYLNIIPVLFIPLGVWAFPFYLPFSKMILFFSLAYISGQEERFAVPGIAAKIITLIFFILLPLSLYFHSRYIASVYYHSEGLAWFASDTVKSLEELNKGIDQCPYNGYNYFSAGALLLDNGEFEGIEYLLDSLQYLNNSKTYLYLARGFRDFEMAEDSKDWYEKFLFIRPNSMTARREYRDLLDEYGLED
ncbi:MAG: O-antigen ligase family protein [bacterium]|nr:O-antigen ligase family protein [bacterium]